MELHNLPKTTTKSKKRLGRGYGSGKGGHTVGRGQKGQKSRNKISLVFEGTKFRKSLIKRIPLRRGKGKLKPGKKPVIVNIKYLNLLPTGSVVNIESLAKTKIVDPKEATEFEVKILGEGKLGVALKVALPCSKGAAEKIKEVGGEIIKSKIRREEKKKAKKEKSALPAGRQVKIRRKSVKSKNSTKTMKVKKERTKDE